MVCELYLNKAVTKTSMESYDTFQKLKNRAFIILIIFIILEN